MKYYLGYYSCEKIKDEKRLVAPAAENKMNYVISALLDASDEDICVITPAQTTLNKFVKGTKQKISNRVFLKTFSSFNSKNKLFRVLGHLITRLSLIIYLLFNIKADDHLFVYHSLYLMRIVKFLKKFKKCRLTVEVEELYSDVTQDDNLRKKELEYFEFADSYIFITELLKNQVNTKKPSAVSHGTYKAESELGFSFDDEKIHVVYAGTFRKAKGGASTAIYVAEYLDENYVLEILGKGNEEETESVKSLIDDISKKTKCKINYVGFKSGEDFNSYVQACHIGLSTQPPDAKFNATSFPSKVLMYMSNGLRVVSVKIPAVETSNVREYIYYYENQDAFEIAKAVRSVDFSDNYDSREILSKLHLEFVEQLKALL